jgi:hypothetical protein
VIDAESIVSTVIGISDCHIVLAQIEIGQMRYSRGDRRPRIGVTGVPPDGVTVIVPLVRPGQVIDVQRWHLSRAMAE